MQGIVTHYASDLHKVREKLTDIRSLTEKATAPKIIKDAIINDIDRVFALLKKGQSHDNKVGGKQR